MKNYGRFYRYILVVIFCLSAATAFAAPQIIKGEETVTLSGKLVEAKGEDIHEKPVTYHGLQLNGPVVIIYENGEAEVTILKLWLNKQQELIFKKLLGKQVRITGTVHYYWFGPSTAPNPAKLEVTNVSKW